MAEDVKVTVTPNLTGLETNGRLLLQAVYSIQQAILSAFPRVTGSFTLSAAATTTVTQTQTTSTSVISLIPANAAAATLISGAKNLYVSSKTDGSGFVVSTADGTVAAGTENFQYLLINPA